MEFNILIALILITFIATFIRSTFGFGDALLAMPLLSLFFDIKIVTPLMALIALFIAFSIFINNRNKVEFKSAWRLIIFSLLGIPLGIWGLKDIDENIIKIILGIIILLFSIYNLFKPGIFKLENEKHAWIFGFTAGVLGGAYNTNGPPIIIYSSLKKWKPQNFRATLQAYFFLTGILIVLSHLLAGNYNINVITYFAYCLPGVVIAIVLGKHINKIIPLTKFHKYIYIALLILGTILIINSI